METGYWVALGILALGIILFLYFYNKRKYRSIDLPEPEAVKHYKKARDKLSKVKPELEPDDSEPSGIGVGSVIAAVIGIVVLIAVVSSTTSMIKSICQDSVLNFTATDGTNVLCGDGNMMSVITTVMIIGALLGVVYAIYNALVGPRLL
jgi:hypothetical protein